MKNTIVLFICMCLSTFAFSQIGIKGGITNTGTVSGSDLVKEKSYGQGYTVGVFYDHCLGCDFSLRPEVNYTERVSSYNIGDNSFENTHNYIEVPVNIHYKVYKPFFVSLGPQFMYRLSSNIKASKGSEAFNLTDVNKSFYKYDIGANLSIGADFKNFFIDARAYRGFRSIFKGDETLKIGSEKIKNFTFDFTAGYKF